MNKLYPTKEIYSGWLYSLSYTDGIATSDGVTPIHFYVFKYNGILKGSLETLEEIENFLWYESSMGNSILSNTLKN